MANISEEDFLYINGVLDFCGNFIEKYGKNYHRFLTQDINIIYIFIRNLECNIYKIKNSIEVRIDIERNKDFFDKYIKYSVCNVNPQLIPAKYTQGIIDGCLSLQRQTFYFTFKKEKAEKVCKILSLESKTVDSREIIYLNEEAIKNLLSRMPDSNKLNRKIQKITDEIIDTIKLENNILLNKRKKIRQEVKKEKIMLEKQQKIKEKKYLRQLKINSEKIDREFRKKNREKLAQEKIKREIESPNKICGKCKIEFPKTEFRINNRHYTGHGHVCKKCHYLYYGRPRYLLKKKELNSYSREKLKNVSKEKRKEYKKNCAEIPEYRMRERVRKQLYNALRKINTKCKAGNFEGLVGLSPCKFKEHLESQFTEEMNWDNYNTYWVIDHIVPMAKFNLKIRSQQEACCNYKNLRPLSRKDNGIKSDRITEENIELARVLKPTFLPENFTLEQANRRVNNYNKEELPVNLN